MLATPKTQRRIAVALDRVAAYPRSIFTGIATYACEHGPWRFVPIVAPALLPGLSLGALQADGIIARIGTRTTARAMRETGLPVVNVGSPLDADVASVSLDDAAVGRAGAEHLIREDLPSLAFCGVQGIWYSKLREEGFIAAVAEAGRACSVYNGVPHVDPNTHQSHDARFDEWLAALPRPVGLMACDDSRARHIADSCRRLGIRVPEDVAIVGAGNDVLTCEMTDPPLSSVALAAERVGFEAARVLEQLMDGKPAPPRPKVIPPVGMVARFSTHVDAPADADVARAVRFIRESAQEGISVDDVLEIVVMSRRSLEIRFRHALGRSPAEEIRRVRIERAKRMLIETDAGMEGVARGAGFSSANQLSETFRRETGVSPSHFRRQFRAV